MISEASADQATQLPPAPPGTAYRLRKLIQQPHRKTSDTYVTTGVFAHSAPNAERPGLYRAGCFVLDCDLSDFAAAQSGATGAAFEPAAKEWKSRLHELDDSALDAAIKVQADFVSAWAAHLLGAAPTVVVSSGYGVHAYFWIHDSQGFGADVDRVRAFNKALVERLNAACGFRLADPQAVDAGTRILRVVGSTNTKNPAKPRTVRALYGDAARRFDLDALAQNVAIPATASAPAGGALSHFPNPAERPPAPAKSASSAHTDDADPEPFARLFAKSEAEAAEALNLLFTTCPFFLWACENAAALKRESWRGAATNIAAVAGEFGRRCFHEFSALDPARYSARDCDFVYSDALKSAASHGPMTYAQLSQNGDWPGSGPAQLKSPAALRFVGKGTAKLLTDPNGQGENAVKINSKTGFPEKTAGNLRKLLRIDEKYGKRLRFNEMHLRIELDGAPFGDEGFGDVQEYIEDAYKVAFAKPVVVDAVREIAAENPYAPVADWLDSLKWDGTPRIQQVVSEVLNAQPKALYYDFVRKFLIGAVARGMCKTPNGVKVDTALILKGEQGIKKSTFFNTLAGGFFCDSSMDLRSKDAFMVLQSAWIIEWSEFDYTLSRHQQSAVRAFLSAKVDSYRPPYGREVVTKPRRCVIVGTTNEDYFLHDPTGSRRFWVIETPGVNVDLLRDIRDQVWAEAVAAYRAGEQWHLDGDSDKERAELASQYQQEEPWEAIVTRWIADKKIEDVSIERVLIECILKDAKDWKGDDTKTIARILRKSGFHRYQRMIEGKREYRYRKIGAAESAPSSNVVALHAVRPELARLFKEVP